MKVPNGTGPGVRRSKRPLLASRTRCNVLWKPPKFGNKVKNGNKVQFGNKFAKDLGRFIIQICPTYNDERCSRHMLIKINIYCQYIILTI